VCAAENGQRPGAQGASGASFAMDEESHCLKCGHSVPERPLGCKWPCPNCGFLSDRA
jgi:predicted RNA-binding Zn-ribbon protein involved in translation (DUF1610 family)